MPPPCLPSTGSVISCSGAINLANTGSVRLVVDDVLVTSSIGVQTATCSLASATLNLTANNATLLPGQALVCSFSVVTTQSAYEAGNIVFGVEAVGVAAYGTHPDLAASGVIGGVVSCCAVCCVHALCCALTRLPLHMCS